MSQDSLEVVELDNDQLEALLRRAEAGAFEQEDYETIGHILRSYVFVTGALRDKKMAINRLRKVLFGTSTEKTDKVVGTSNQTPPPAAKDDDQQPPPPSTGDDPADKKRPGHGRNPADVYQGGLQVEVPHASLEAGDACPECRGTLYEKPPAVIVRIVGKAPLQATVYRMQRLRCHLCGKVFQAERPEEAGDQKYDATAASMIALLKYGSGLPFNRLAGLQRNLQVPLPASTQWDVHAFAPTIQPAFAELLRQAAQGEVLYNDDTTIKILSLMGDRARVDNADVDNDRTGLFTSGIVATGGGQRIALFFSGRQHAGENLADVLRLRAEELARPIQMCDALSRNLTGDLQTIVANCLAHARRKFTEVHDLFPDECKYVLEAFKVVYHNDAKAREQAMSPRARLRWHSAQSAPTMQRLHNWLNRQFDDKLVEPNSALGGAIQYLLNHWRKLTLFLRQPGAPLDNNICERALKKAILHRKNALFYKTQNGARVGDMYMSLIHTCELCGVNPFDYLTALHRHADDLTAAPQRWMPWNYQDALVGEAAPAMPG